MRINIIGRGPGYEEGLTAEGEKWGINYFHPSLDILFEIHPEGHPYHEKLKRERDNAEAADILLCTQANYPMEEVSKWANTDYFGSSTDWIIAFAINRVVRSAIAIQMEIHLYGVTMDDIGDHYEKRCCTDFWCGMAMGRGIKVVVHGNSKVMTTEDGLTYGTFQPMKRIYLTNTDLNTL